MRIRNLKNSDEIINNSIYIIKELNKNTFDNNNEIHIEIGMGKGKFILENAIKNPNINYIGIERFDTIMAKAIKNIEKYDLKNLKLIKCDALYLKDYIKTKINKIYLNFSDPWPKERHTKRRLTSDTFLNIYKDLFKTKQNIEIKTDNKSLFEFSIINLTNNNYKIKEIYLDLHNSNIKDIITTEYEEKFIKKQNPIYKMIVEKQ